MVIGIIRTSTIQQEVETQRVELIDFMNKDGVSDYIIIGEAGSSAIKMDAAYQKNMDKVYQLINSGNVTCIYAWALDRIGRNEEFMVHFKNVLISNKIQLKIVNPSLTLLNNDGSVNSGMEIAFSLYITMAKQEMEQKKSRFKRALKRNAEQGKFWGGSTITYGYKVSKDNVLVPDEKEANVIRLLFSLYSTGKYSYKTLSKEMCDRGYTFCTEIFCNKKLKSTAYIGYSKTKCNHDRVYVPIISQELFDKCRNIASNNRTGDISKESKHHYFGNKLLVCGDCGKYYTAKTMVYRCSKHLYGNCDNSISVSIPFVDGLIWTIAKEQELDFRLNEKEKMVKSLSEEMEVLNNKEAALINRLKSIEPKRERLVDMYTDGIISKDKMNEKIKGIKEEEKEINNLLLEVEERRKDCNNLITVAKKPVSYEKLMNELTKLMTINSEDKMKEIITRHIKKVIVSGEGGKCVSLEFVFKSGKENVIYLYYPKKKGYRLYIGNVPQIETYIVRDNDTISFDTKRDWVNEQLAQKLLE